MTTINWPGNPGKIYKYWLSVPGTSFKDEDGNYGFARQLPNGNFVPLYFGETNSLHLRLSNLSNHERWTEAKRPGATHLMSHTTPAGEQARLVEERDLIQKWNPTMNVQHRKAL